MDRTAGELLQGAAAFAARHSTEEHQTLAAALLGKAAWVDTLRGEAAAALCAARGMQEDYLRRIAREEEDVVDQDDARAIEEASRGMEALMADGSPFVNSPEKAAAAAAICEAVAEGMAEEMAELAHRIRAGAEVFGARPGEDDRSLVSRLLSKAEAAERHGVQARAMAAIFRGFRFSLPLQI
ncbi:hypothetical protein BRADI_4g43133v3 [Brachypodium distachyon]|uniref:Uncharacterized protein n=1 Tax=Brachypodium distachyon TaxID=15368 RepID=A0A0Q3LII4_BRADI|nr:hypothetical protein BRADI_4g43133v3 [Brachypodium distachyon]